MATSDLAEPTRRDFLYIATGAVGAVGVAAAVWPFINQMNPDASALALSTVEVDIGSIAPGASIKVMWRGKPVFIRNRTPEEIQSAAGVPVAELPDPDARNANHPGADASDANRAAAGKENWLIMVGVCTHLGCIPLGEQGEFGGWFCPCHGSVYDTAGRIRRGPAPENMHVPVYSFLTDTRIRIG
ncbi:ubiquinol-cytochrome c reductase iron-sulfur subunit [Prosthecomicrobium pneumaticum]|uniref:Ubiquinol-cytochrome c reductase iron-sulfur subunit n=1 Tax=Prosthecomicrobium pneumaticum TaxID=81895 RepID=A0A7W9FJR1_9HYPH|nr:ubiquinol-cytochrome c reductase iron-sulfur subunit [Prosthecomicrobium pneumaticum]MBB5751992.1 ubiquinol-cytochrome c reductase iron-sulfur subunit [Prosthecomicrobium pneumaticum]